MAEAGPGRSNQPPEPRSLELELEYSVRVPYFTLPSGTLLECVFVFVFVFVFVNREEGVILSACY